MHPSIDAPMVFHVRIVSGRGGGPEKTILRSPEHLERLGYRGMAVYLHDEGDDGFQELCDWAARENCPMLGVPDGGATDFSLVSKLTELCKEHDVRIWHGHDYKSNLFGLLVRRKLKKQGIPLTLVSTAHGWVHKTWKTPLYFGIDRACLRRYEHVIAVSGDLYETCKRSRVKSDRLTLIHNAIESDRFGSNAHTKQAAEGRARLTLGAVGRLAHEKGFHYLIETVARLRNKGHDIALEIAGEGPDKETLQELIQETGHGDAIQLLGHQSDKHALYSRFDVFVLSSLREGLPNVVLEAMAMGLPILATRCGGVEEALDDGVDSLLCDIGSADALEAPLEKLVSEAHLRQRLGGAARDRVERQFDFGKRMERIAAIYSKLGVRPKT